MGYGREEVCVCVCVCVCAVSVKCLNVKCVFLWLCSFIVVNGTVFAYSTLRRVVAPAFVFVIIVVLRLHLCAPVDGTLLVSTFYTVFLLHNTYFLYKFKLSSFIPNGTASVRICQQTIVKRLFIGKIDRIQKMLYI